MVATLIEANSHYITHTHKTEARAQQRKQRQKIPQTRENVRNKKNTNTPPQPHMETTTTTQGKSGVAKTLATTSIQKNQMHTRIQGTKRILQTNQCHPQALKHIQTHTAKPTCMQTTTCNISSTNIVTLLIATSYHFTRLQPSPNSWQRGHFVVTQ